jgi:hypothetical protein
LARNVGVAELHEGLKSTRRIPVVGGCAVLKVPDAALAGISPDRADRRDRSRGGDWRGVAYPLPATFLLSGGRRAGVLGLELDDVSFDRGTITFRPPAHRRLASHRRLVCYWERYCSCGPSATERIRHRAGDLAVWQNDGLKSSFRDA